MTTCLDDIACGRRTIIGIRDYDQCPVPESGLYLQDFVYGLTLRKAAQVASAEYVSGVQLLRDKCALGAKLVFSDFSQYVNQFFNFNALVETRVLNRFDGTTIPAAAAQRGLVFKRWRSELARIYIEELYLKCAAGGVLTITVTDGQTVTNYQAQVVADEETTVVLNHWCNAEQVRVTFNQTVFPVYTRDIPGKFTGSSGCAGCGTTRHAQKGLYVTGWDGAQERPRMYGMGARASVRCREELLLCPLIPRMYFLMGQRAGLEFLHEVPNSTRLTPAVMFDAGKAEAQAEKLQIRYWNDYKAFTKTILRHLQAQKADCLTCNSDRYVQQTP